MSLQIKSETNETSGLTCWWIEDEYGGRVLASPGFVDPMECQKNLDLVRQCFREESKT